MDLFKREPKYIFIELDKAVKLPELTPDLKETIKTLQYHPGFVYLTQKLRIQRGLIERYLQEGFELDEKQLRYLQAGVFWLAYLDRELKTATHVPAPTRPADDSEAELFQQIQSNMDLIGVEQ